MKPWRPHCRLHEFLHVRVVLAGRDDQDDPNRWGYKIYKTYKGFIKQHLLVIL